MCSPDPPGRDDFLGDPMLGMGGDFLDDALVLDDVLMLATKVVKVGRNIGRSPTSEAQMKTDQELTFITCGWHLHFQDFPDSQSTLEFSWPRVASNFFTTTAVATTGTTSHIPTCSLSHCTS